MNRIETFTHKGQEYEVRAIARTDGYAIRTFLNNKQISPTYSITFETAIDFVNSGWGDAVDDLIQTAKNDIVRGHLDELAKALKDAENPPA